MKKQIIAHRGFWTNKEEQNRTCAILSALINKYSVEVDIRFSDEYSNQEYLSHEKSNEFFEDILIKRDCMDKATQEGHVLAINIKENKDPFLVFNLFKDKENYFVFDIELACPERFEEYLETFGPNNTARRLDKDNMHSFNPEEEQCNIIWFDPYYEKQFHSEGSPEEYMQEWFPILSKCKEAGKRIYFAAPDLHGLRLSDVDVKIAMECDGVCTDLPRFYDLQLNGRST